MYLDGSNFKPHGYVPGDSVCGLLRGLLMQYRDCCLIPANDPPYADCILRLTSLDDEARRAVAVQSPGRVRTFVLAANIPQGRGNRCAISQRRSPTSDSPVIGSLQIYVESRMPIRSCDVIATNRRAWPFVVSTRSRHRLPDIGILGRGLSTV